MKALALLSLGIVSFGLTACGSGNQKSGLVNGIEKTVVGEKPCAVADRTQCPVIRVTMSVNKAALLGQEFLYGADLQYSSFHHAAWDLYQQSIAIGHIPARFRIAGSELQLIADNKRLFPSDVNHPEQVLSRFKILSENETTMEITGANSGIFLSQVFEATRAEDSTGLLFVASGAAPRDVNIRSVEYVGQGSYLLQETSVQLADGVIAEFMESIMPRSTIAPGADFEKFEMDPKHPAGGDKGFVGRFRFLLGEKVYDGEKAHGFAQHFDISNGATIDWYVTRNVPDEYLSALKTGVEGWNRYFRSFKGIERDVVLFKGKLPEGVHIGDPRYNVINWDSRQVAGAAYESQATDPYTGKQSHSLIYLPAAWVKIGTDYWENGQFADREAVAQKVGPFSQRHNPNGNSSLGRAQCFRDLDSAAALIASGKVDNVKDFGIELLKAVILHEVGHALGLGHNFKGSLVYDRSNEKSVFSTSIMDYNDYDLERSAFNGLESADGPLLEYDRQALSALYNKGRDIKDSDPVLPTCNDKEADNEAGGVDPLCIRYDLEKDPSLSVETAFQRLSEREMKGDVSLSQALFRASLKVLTQEALEKVKTKDELKSLSEKFIRTINGVMTFYLSGGKGSAARAVRTNVKLLYAFTEKTLPETYNEKEMRERAFKGVQQMIGTMELSLPVQRTLREVEEAALISFGKTPYIRGLGETGAEKDIAAILEEFAKNRENFLKDSDKGLAKARVFVLAGLNRHTDVSFYFKNSSGLPDFEKAIVSLLADIVVAKDARTAAERKAAAKSLVSFKAQSTLAVQGAVTTIEAERAVAVDHQGRETADQLLEILKDSGSSSAKK